MASARALPLPELQDGEFETLTSCQYFKLDAMSLQEKTVSLDTRGESFHGLTVIEGQVQVSAQGEAFVINKFDTLMIPACCGAYQIKPLQKSRVLRAGI